MIIENKDGSKEDVRLLVRVTPDGEDEKQIITNWNYINSHLKVVTGFVQLHSIFGFKTKDGLPFTQYEFDFKCPDDFERAYDWLVEYFRLTLGLDKDYQNGNHLPSVLFGVRLVQRSN